ncbi:MAG: hypothetical protein ACP5VQ_04865, partial [Phycisphaerae bacterium]
AQPWENARYLHRTFIVYCTAGKAGRLCEVSRTAAWPGKIATLGVNGHRRSIAHIGRFHNADVSGLFTFGGCGDATTKTRERVAALIRKRLLFNAFARSKL